MSEIITPTAIREELGGGVYRNTISIRPVAYDDNGTLRPIARDWCDGDVERPHMVTAARLMTSVAADGMRRIHPTREIDRFFEIGAPYIQQAGEWQQVSLGAAERTGNLLAWQTAVANLYIRHLGHAVKLGILLKNGWTPPNDRFAFPVGIQGLTRSGGALLADGVPVMRMRPFTVEDLDNPDDVRPVAHDFVNVAGQWYVVCTLPDLTGMSRPLVDPTFEDQPDATDGKDTYIKSSDEAFNNATGALLYSRLSGLQRRSLIYWDVSSVSGTVTSAEIDFTVYNTGSASVPIHRILAANSAWTESGATWGHAVASTTRWAGDSGSDGGADAGCTQSGTDYAAASMGTMAFSGIAQYGGMNVSLSTSEVQEWVDGNNYGLVFGSVGSSDHSVYSSDIGTPSYRPKLTIVYTAGGVTVSCDALTFTMSVPDLDLVPGAVALTMDALSLTSSAPDLDLVPGAVSLMVDALNLTASAPDLTVTPGAIALVLDALSLTSATPDLTVTPGAVALVLDALTLAGSTPDLTVTPGAIAVLLDALTGTASVPDLAVTPGAIAVMLDALALAGSTPDLSVSLSEAVAVVLDALSLTASAPDLTVTPGEVAILLDALTLTGNTPDLAILTGAVAIALDALDLSISAPDLVVALGALYVALDALTLTASAPDLAPGFVVLLDPLTLTLTPLDLSLDVLLKLDVTIADAVVTTLTIGDAVVTVLTVSDAEAYTVTIGDSTL